MCGVAILPRLQEFIVDADQDLITREWIWLHYGASPISCWCFACVAGIAVMAPSTSRFFFWMQRRCAKNLVQRKGNVFVCEEPRFMLKTIIRIPNHTGVQSQQLGERTYAKPFLFEPTDWVVEPANPRHGLASHLHVIWDNFRRARKTAIKLTNGRVFFLILVFCHTKELADICKAGDRWSAACHNWKHCSHCWRLRVKPTGLVAEFSLHQNRIEFHDVPCLACQFNRTVYVSLVALARGTPRSSYFALFFLLYITLIVFAVIRATRWGWVRTFV